MKPGRVLFVLMALLGVASSSNILAMFITHIRSHLIVHMAVARTLVDRGHNVTVITSQPLNDPNPGYRHIFLKTLQVSQDIADQIIDNFSPLAHPFKTIELGKQLADNISNFPFDPEFRKFLMEGNQFDLMLLGYEINEGHLGVAAHFKCPTILSWMLPPIGHVSRLIGNPTLPAFVPAVPFVSPRPMNFFARVKNLMVVALERVISFIVEMVQSIYYKKIIPPGRFPSLDEMTRNISLIFVNHHFSEGPIRPLVPGLVEIGGIQIKEKIDPLPKDIDEFLENSPQGAILFSLGTYVRCDFFSRHTIDIIHKVLSTLPYNVIWRWDREAQPANASNILFKKWFPQSDILAHRNIKLFITHAGRGGISESIYHAVPMVALPILDDQPVNADSMQFKGLGLTLDHATLTEESFRKAILQVIEDDKYKKAVQHFRQIYLDRPMTARESVIYWTEYVIRHRGAPHMQSPLKNLNFIQENSLDTISFVTFIIYVMLRLSRMFASLLRKLVGRVMQRKKAKHD